MTAEMKILVSLCLLLLCCVTSKGRPQLDSQDHKTPSTKPSSEENLSEEVHEEIEKNLHHLPKVSTEKHTGILEDHNDQSRKPDSGHLSAHLTIAEQVTRPESLLYKHKYSDDLESGFVHHINAQLEKHQETSENEKEHFQKDNSEESSALHRLKPKENTEQNESSETHGSEHDSSKHLNNQQEKHKEASENHHGSAKHDSAHLISNNNKEKHSGQTRDHHGLSLGSVHHIDVQLEKHQETPENEKGHFQKDNSEESSALHRLQQNESSEKHGLDHDSSKHLNNQQEKHKEASENHHGSAKHDSARLISNDNEEKHSGQTRDHHGLSLGSVHHINAQLEKHHETPENEKGHFQKDNSEESSALHRLQQNESSEKHGLDHDSSKHLNNQQEKHKEASENHHDSAKHDSAHLISNNNEDKHSGQTRDYHDLSLDSVPHIDAQLEKHKETPENEKRHFQKDNSEESSVLHRLQLEENTEHNESSEKHGSEHDSSKHLNNQQEKHKEASENLHDSAKHDSTHLISNDNEEKQSGQTRDHHGLSLDSVHKRNDSKVSNQEMIRPSDQSTELLPKLKDHTLEEKHVEINRNAQTVDNKHTEKHYTSYGVKTEINENISTIERNSKDEGKNHQGNITGLSYTGTDNMESRKRTEKPETQSSMKIQSHVSQSEHDQYDNEDESFEKQNTPSTEFLREETKPHFKQHSEHDLQHHIQIHDQSSSIKTTFISEEHQTATTQNPHEQKSNENNQKQNTDREAKSYPLFSNKETNSKDVGRNVENNSFEHREEAKLSEIVKSSVVPPIVTSKDLFSDEMARDICGDSWHFFGGNPCIAKCDGEGWGLFVRMGGKVKCRKSANGTFGIVGTCRYGLCV